MIDEGELNKAITEDLVFNIGPIRPPSEAESLLFQITAGCSWNKCKFCDLYKTDGFRTYTVEELKRNIDVMGALRDRAIKHKLANGSWDSAAYARELASLNFEEQNCYALIFNWLKKGGKNVFLQDGNSLVLSGKKLIEVLEYLKKTFPHIERITSYGRADSLARVTEEEFRELKAVGLTRIHSGYESGSDEVLALIKKGTSQEQEIIAGQKIKDAGIQFSIYFMPGIGGKALTIQNALETAKVVKAINPDFLRIRTSVLKPSSLLWNDYMAGSYELCSENEKLEEIRIIIDECGGCTGNIVSDHIINLIQSIEGNLTRDREYMLALIDQYFKLDKAAQRNYQIARRSGVVREPEDMNRLPMEYINRFRAISRKYPSEEAWESLMNEILGSYI